MQLRELGWESVVFKDPDGGQIVLWPYLPCVRMPQKLRVRKWDGLALLQSSDDLSVIKEEEESDLQSPGIHIDSVSSLGTAFSILINNLKELDIDAPFIPDPEIIRLIHHSENSRDGLPIYAIEPNSDDSRWSEWLTSCADEYVKIKNLISSIWRSRRWRKNRKFAITRVMRSKYVNAEIGAASAICAAWWMEQILPLSKELISEKDKRFSSRLRGALSDLRDSRVDFSPTDGPILLVPVEQAYLPQLEKSLFSIGDIEKMRPE